MTRRRHDPIIPVAALQETFWRALWTDAPDAVADLAELVEALAAADIASALLMGEAKARECGDHKRRETTEVWARRWRLATPAGVVPAWVTAMGAETLRFWIMDPFQWVKRVVLPWRILDVFNTDSIPAPRGVVPGLRENAQDYRRRLQQAVFDHEDDLVRRGLAVADRGHATEILGVLVRHRTSAASWDDLASETMRDERGLRREANRLAHALGLR